MFSLFIALLSGSHVSSGAPTPQPVLTIQVLFLGPQPLLDTQLTSCVNLGHEVTPLGIYIALAGPWEQNLSWPKE